MKLLIAIGGGGGGDHAVSTTSSAEERQRTPVLDDQSPSLSLSDRDLIPKQNPIPTAFFFFSVPEIRAGVRLSCPFSNCIGLFATFSPDQSDRAELRRRRCSRSNPQIVSKKKTPRFTQRNNATMEQAELKLTYAFVSIFVEILENVYASNTNEFGSLVHLSFVVTCFTLVRPPIISPFAGQTHPGSPVLPLDVVLPSLCLKVY